MNWPMVPLGELITDTQYGTSTKSNEAGKGQPVLRMNNITPEGRFDTSSLKWVELPKEERERLTLERGDLLFNRTNSRELVGKTGVWDGPDGYTFAGYLVRVRLKNDRVLAGWVSAYLNSPHGKASLFHMAKPSVNMANISATDLLRLDVPVAPMEHQRQSIERLARADAIRRKRKEAIGLTDDLLRATFLKMFGDPVTNPKGWNVVALAEAFSEDPRIGTLVSAEESGDFPVVRVGEVGDYDIALSRSGRVSLSAAEAERFMLKQGDVVLARAIGSEDHLGKASVLQSHHEPVAFDSHVMRLRFRDDLLDPYFFVQWLRSPGGRARFMREAGRTAVQFNVNGKQIARVLIPLPPMREQRVFRSFFDHLRRVRASSQAIAVNSDTLFSSLVHRVFVGPSAS